jgi:hypothetical protein
MGLMNNWMNDDPWAMGVLEPFLLLWAGILTTTAIVMPSPIKPSALKSPSAYFPCRILP